ncbi:fertilization-influencing membrane protein [Suncus etruscus]|uniref:fertilization-influencing membrane protein n=1 Tax=Suncus etruscus TaxID=109475 RepID=UPI002110D9C3|nr:fertilization-influencing membrane protein [Suncus etruscus]
MTQQGPKSASTFGNGVQHLFDVCQRLLPGSSAPSLQSAKTLALQTESSLSRDFFDYSDSDQARLLTVARVIGERPILFFNSGSGSSFFSQILVGSLLVAFFFVLFQFCTHMSFQKGA